MKRRRGLSLLQKRNVKGFMFILPWLIGFIIFYARSMIMTAQFSLSTMTTSTSGGYTLEWAGLSNYIYAFRAHGTFKQVLTTSILNMLVDVPLITFFSLFMAILLNRRFKGRTIVRAIFFLPVILSSGVILGVESNNALLSSVQDMIQENGSSNSITVAIQDILMTSGMGSKIFEVVFDIVDGIYDVAIASGIQIIIFLSGLQTISESMYEAAAIEGCTKWESLWKITFPMISSLFLVNWIYTIIDFCMRSDNAVMEKISDEMIVQINYGYSSALAWVYFLIVMVIIGISSLIISKGVYYYE